MVQKDAEQESEMRAEIQEMKKEQASISMMDEFARYARLERKINKMTDKLKTHGERRERLSQLSEPKRTPWKASSCKMATHCINKTLLVPLNWIGDCRPSASKLVLPKRTTNQPWIHMEQILKI